MATVGSVVHRGGWIPMLIWHRMRASDDSIRVPEQGQKQLLSVGCESQKVHLGAIHRH